MGDDNIRIAHTENLFREVNERIAETADWFDAKETDFICECADAACTERVNAPLDEYEHVRAESTHFLLCEGHERPRVERIVKRARNYAVVEKFQTTIARIVTQLDPRAA